MIRTFCNKLSIGKIINLLKLVISYFLSSIYHKPILLGMPAAISIEPTNRCNLSCPECPVGNDSLTRNKAEFDIVLNQKIINEIGKYLFSILYYFQGEPFLNPKLFEMIQFAGQKGIYTICSTNGHFLTLENTEKIINSGLDKLIISFDGTTDETYKKYRKNGSFDKLIEGIKTIVASKKKMKSKLPNIVLQFLILKSNEHQIDKAKEMAKELGVDKIIFKTAQFYDFKNGNSQIPTNPKYSRYNKNENGTYSIKAKLKNHCWRMWSNPVITVSGEVSVCCFDKNAQFKICSINEKSFREIWYSEQYQNFRKAIFKNRKTIDICTNCTEGLLKVFS